VNKWFAKAGEFPKKNALTPIGATAFGVFGASVAAAAYLGETSMGWTILVLGSLPLLATVWGFCYFAIRDPNRLQTEDYRIQEKYLHTIDVKAVDPGGHFAPRGARPISVTPQSQADQIKKNDDD